MGRKRVAVFDAKATDCTKAAEAIGKCFAQLGLEADISEFTSMQGFAYSFKNDSDAGMPYDMTFIGLEHLSDVETAWNIRQLDMYRPMFIVSSVSDYGLEGFRLHALDYLPKPVSPVLVLKAIRRIGMRCQPWQTQFVDESSALNPLVYP